jgi:hypothetical protein
MTKLNEQMEMFQFQEGGLEQDGGTQDPVSGNEVPAGSSQAEVRDDIPAMLSEGEFVFPADVVRYIGLETLMNIRQQAKAGLKRMEDMGQMGNSNEATIPDDVPFTVDDLEVEDAPKEMFVGGVIPSGGFGIPPATTMPFTDYSPVMPSNGGRLNLNPNQLGGLFGFQPQQAQTPIVPTTAPTYNVQGQQTNKLYNVPTFTPQQAVGTFETLTGDKPGGFGQTDVIKTYVNEDGMELRIPFKGGNPIYDIPPGYTEKKEEKTQEAIKPKDTAVKTTQVTGTRQDEGESIRQQQPIDAKISEQKDRFNITSSRGFDVLNLLPGAGIAKFFKDVVGVQPTGKGIVGALTPKQTEEKKTFNEYVDTLTGDKKRRHDRYESLLRTPITGFVGNKKGDLDPATGGVFDRKGIARNEDGSDATNEFGTRSYASFADFKEDRAAGKQSGWQGGAISKSSYDKLSDTGKANYDKYSEIRGISFDASPEDGPQDTAPTGTAADFGGEPDRFGGGDYKGAFVGKKYKKNKGMKRGGLASKK